MKKKVLLVRFSSFGDVVLLLPVIRKLSRAGYETHVLTKKMYAEIFAANPLAAKLILLEEHKNLLSLAARIRKENYYRIIDLHRNLRSFILRIFFLPRTLVYRKFSFRRFLFLRFRINLLKKNSVVMNYLEPLKRLGIRITPRDANYSLFIDKTAIRKKVKTLAGTGKLIVMAPFAKYPTKEWPYYGKLIKALSRAHKILIVGEKKDGKRAGLLRPALNLCGKLTLNETAYLISRSRLFISNDSGLMHLGCGTGAKMTVLLGSTVKEFGFMPERENIRILEKKGAACRPCHYHGRLSCPKGHLDCLKGISVEEVLKHAP